MGQDLPFPARSRLRCLLRPFRGRPSAKDKVKISFIGPLTGGTAANGLGGRNSAELAVRLRNADPKAKYEYELVVLDDECKPNVAVQVATKAGADRGIVASVSHYCSVAAIAAVETYNRLGLPMVVWGAVLPDITYRNKFAEVHRVNGTMINQNEVAAKLMTSLGFKRWVSIHDTSDYGKGHNQYFSQYRQAGRRRNRRHLRRHHRPAGLHRRADAGEGAQSARSSTSAGSRRSASGCARRWTSSASARCSRARRASSRTPIIEGLGPLAEGSLSFAEGAPMEKLPGGKFFQAEYDKAGFKEPPEAYGAFAFAAMKLVLDKIEEVGPDRKKIAAALRSVVELRLYRRPDQVRRSRAEHRADHHRATSLRTASGWSGRTANTPPASASFAK